MKHNSVWGKILLLVMSVVLVLSCLVACNDDEIGALEDANAAIDADLADLEALLSQTTAKLAEVAAKLEAASAKADAAATAEALAAAKAELAALAASNKTGLTAAQTAIADAQAKLEAIEAKLGNGDITDFSAEIAGIKDAAAALEEKADKYVADYRLATKVLAGAEKVDGKDYSLVAFDKIVAEFAEGFFGTEEFATWAATIRVSLERALSVEDIEDCFDTVTAEIAKRSDLLGTFKAEIEKIEYVTVEEDFLKTVKGIYDLIGEYNDSHEEDLVIEEELLAKFEIIVEAHDNLLLAVEETADAVDAIAAIGKVVYIDSVDALEAADAAIEAYKLAVAVYFENEDYNVYYNFDDEKTDLISNYATYEKAVARYEQLDAADTAKVEIIAVALGYAEKRPLWKDKEALDANKDLYDAWLAEYEIDETADATTIANIYDDGVALLKASIAYADAMTVIYEEFVFVEDKIVGVEALNAAIDALLEANEEIILWTNLADATDLYEMIFALVEEFEDVDDFDEDLDMNLSEMITDVRGEAFMKVYTRMLNLDALNIALDALYDEYVLLKGKVDFNDGQNIEDLKNAVAGNYTYYEVTEGDANYLAIAKVKDINALIVDLEAEYGNLTAKVREIYNKVIDYLDPNVELPLTFGNQIKGYLEEVLKIMALTDNVYLDLTQEGDTEEVNLSTLYENLSTVILKFVAKAEAAQIAAATINAKIAALATSDTLNNYDAIVAVYEELNEWIETYLAADVAIEGDVEEALKAVAKVQIFDGAENAYYSFVTLNNYNKCVKTYNEIDKLINKAYVEWAEIEAEFDGLLDIETLDIHDKAAFDAANTNWTAYKNAYYGASITAGESLGEFEEVTKYNEFNVVYNSVKTLCNGAAAVKASIVNGINGLATVSASNYAAELVKIAAINANIETYKTYCADVINEAAWCDDCLDNKLYVKLIVNEALANLYAYAEATKVVAGDNVDQAIDNIVFVRVAIIKLAKTTEEATGALNSAKKAIEDIAPCAVPGATVNHNDLTHDCVCDKCEYFIGHDDAEDDQDCDCDNCGISLGHVDANPKDCNCDACETFLGHGNVENYYCTNCGEHVCGDIVNEEWEEIPDGICDECGEAVA